MVLWLPVPVALPWLTQRACAPMRSRVELHVVVGDVILVVTLAGITPPGGLETLVAPSRVTPVTLSAADATAGPIIRPITRRAVAIATLRRPAGLCVTRG